MDEYEARIDAWLKANGVADGTSAKAVYLAVDHPGQHGPFTVAHEGDDIVVTGPAGPVVLNGSNDIQSMRMRLDELIANG